MKEHEHTFQFTLILNNVDEFTEGLEDSLYEAGCDDALINFRNRTVYLDFDRKASSLKEAVISAIKQVESSSVGAVVGGVAPDNFVTESEVAQRLSMKKQAISLWIKGQRRASTPFPSPKLKLSNKSPLWKWNEVAEWLYANAIIKQKEIVDTAEFIEDINAALEERNTNTREHRQELVKKLTTNFKTRPGHVVQVH
jgi:predicted DNA-binding transcriptional regulator AlpA